jgi:hypothetical protein
LRAVARMRIDRSGKSAAVEQTALTTRCSQSPLPIANMEINKSGLAKRLSPSPQ